MSPTIGILSLQGCVEPHRPHLKALGVKTLAVRTAEDFAAADGFILPGGESSVMLRLLKVFDLEDIARQAFAKKPVWGICAGAILIASKVEGPAQPSFQLMNYTANRNAYGRQLDSKQREIEGYPVSFIRAPQFTDIGPEVEIKAEIDGQPVWLEQGQNMATAFHPELTPVFPSPWHERFVERVRQA